ncbi:MAG: nucleotide exchange factor GrpE [Chitinispirillaceae bacterium]|nr:nucleotide exchange factor GrpE [Chitinispirillaceae bacterium]
MSKKKEHNISDEKNITVEELNNGNNKNESQLNKESKEENITLKDKNEKIESEVKEEMKSETTEKVEEEKTKLTDVEEKEETEETQETEKEKYEEKIKELEKKLADKNDSYLRLMAEFDNYKKRMAKEYEKMVEFANEKLILELIGVKESFELALKHAEKNTEYNQLLEGVKLIYNKFDSILSANGLSWFGEIGEEFDPQLHDALMKTPHPEIEEGYIAEIYEKGYKLKDRIIKHAKVIVSCGKPVDTIEPVNMPSNSDDKNSK